MRAVILALMVSLPAGAQAAEPIVAYRITNAAEITDSLTGEAGDAARGRALFAEEPRAGCNACHRVPGTPEGDDDPKLEAAPVLAGVGDRLSPGAIRLWIVAPEVIRPATKMPAYYAPGQRQGATDPLYGGPALTAGEIEDLVAYLGSLKTQN